MATGPETFEVPLWRALAVFRIAALAYAAVRVAQNFRVYAHPILSWTVIAVMTGWTVLTIYGYRQARWRLAAARGRPDGRRGLPVSPAILGPRGLALGIANIPVAWIASPVLAWAISGGRRRGVIAALVMGICNLITFGSYGGASLDSPVLLVLAGLAVGHVARLSVDAQARLQRATELEAATRERERLARGIHDSVLQVLALVQRRGAELGGEAAELGRLAGEQETALRMLVGSDGRARIDGEVDLRTALGRYASPTVSLVTPAHLVLLPATVAEELALAVGAALANVEQHCARYPGVGTRGDGGQRRARHHPRRRAGDPARPAGGGAADGRLGVAQSIKGRMRELGGTVAFTSAPGQGTEVELRVP